MLRENICAVHTCVCVYRERADETKCSRGWIWWAHSCFWSHCPEQLYEVGGRKVGSVAMSSWEFPEPYSMDGSSHSWVIPPHTHTTPVLLLWSSATSNSSLQLCMSSLLNAHCPESYSPFHCSGATVQNVHIHSWLRHCFWVSLFHCREGHCGVKQWKVRGVREQHGGPIAEPEMVRAKRNQGTFPEGKRGCFHTKSGEGWSRTQDVYKDVCF